MPLLSVQHSAFSSIKHPFLWVSGVVLSAIGVTSALPGWAGDVTVQGGAVTVQVGDYEGPRAVYSRDSDRDYRDRGSNHRYNDGRYDNEIEDSVLINPVIIDSSIEDSVLIDPVIVNPSGYGYDRYGYDGYGNNDGRVYSTGGTRPTCQVLSNFRAACN